MFLIAVIKFSCSQLNKVTLLSLPYNPKITPRGPFLDLNVSRRKIKIINLSLCLTLFSPATPFTSHSFQLSQKRHDSTWNGY